MKPEDKVREKIDDILKQVGFVIQDREEFNRNASLGVAVREFVMSDESKADYLLFIDGKACGVIEAKKEGISLSGIELQAKHYASHIPKELRIWQNPLPFIYVSNFNEIYFADLREQDYSSRQIFSFHTPESLFENLKRDKTLRDSLKEIPKLDTVGLRKCQIEAIERLDNSLKLNKPRSLIQMATGSGKTFTACNFTYRLLKFAKAKRILFLVDRNNLGRQTKKEFDNFKLNDDGRKFSEVYITSHLQNNHIDKDAKVIITTIQRLYSMLRGEEEYDFLNEESSAFEISMGKPKELIYNPKFPIDFFDFIIVDECHRSIYGEWRQILEYFDAFIIGLTATPSKYTLGFFGQNIVSEYPLERSVIDKVNVNCEIFRIKTKISEEGGIIEKGFYIPLKDKKTRKMIYKTIDEDIEYKKSDLDRSVLVPNQIRTIMQCYKDSVFTELFPERDATWIPKTLIFAKDDNHAEEIVKITREVFSKGNEFCQKITYNIGKQNPEELIKSFRISPEFRIAVTVDMIATGTDIKPLEVLIFMRDVKSQMYYEQMKGRGVRSININDLKSVTPNATGKTHFYLIDAVGVTESQKSLSQPLERKRNLSFKKLLENIAKGASDDDTLSTLALRLSIIETKLSEEDNKNLLELTKGKSLVNISNEILNSIDSDFTEGKSDEEILKIKDEALKPFNSPHFREFLVNICSKTSIYVDELAVDEVINSEHSVENANITIKNFREFININKDELDALSIIYNNSYKNRKLTYKSIDELNQKLKNENLYISDIWRAFAFTEKNKVKLIKNPEKQLTNLIQLVRFALGQDKELQDFSSIANSRFNLWRGRQIKKGITFSEEQDRFLEIIKDNIISNACIEVDDIQNMCYDEGGIFKAKKLFGENLEPLLEDIYLSLVS
ncbi:type I restriction endonuclease subunit R [uncultured Brachyspira sp.]|uniref:type I restriction endonuclease subunit R n=1 Tax=uncultured Brachyspira sp. TaxID=221953 RepID=UPI00259B6F39|nr:type I restriction endonuclease subunit R [uncultured Brachyspira sp.]